MNKDQIAAVILIMFFIFCLLRRFNQAGRHPHNESESVKSASTVVVWLTLSAILVSTIGLILFFIVGFYKALTELNLPMAPTLALIAAGLVIAIYGGWRILKLDLYELPEKAKRKRKRKVKEKRETAALPESHSQS